MTPEEFWSHVDMPDHLPDDELIAACWPWTGGKNKDGYAVANIGGRVTYCHHFAHDFMWGPPPPGHERRHTCHNRICCNPYHFLAGTHLANMADSGLARLTDDQVAEVRARRAAGEKLASIAAALGISRSYAGELCKFKYRRPEAA